MRCSLDRQRRAIALKRLFLLRSLASLLSQLAERDCTIKQIETEMELVARGHDEVMQALNTKYERVKKLLCTMQVGTFPMAFYPFRCCALF